MLSALTRTSIWYTPYYGCTLIRKLLCFIHYDWNISLSGHKQALQILHYYFVWQYLCLIMEFPSEFHSFFSWRYWLLLKTFHDKCYFLFGMKLVWNLDVSLNDYIIWLDGFGGLLYSKGFLWVIEHTLPQERPHLSFTFKIYKCVSKYTKSFEEKKLLRFIWYQ